MGWLDRVRGLFSARSDESGEAAALPEERAAPGLEVLFEEAGEASGRALLDLGPAVGPSLQIYRRFAERVRFADLLSVRSESGMAGALAALPSPADESFDLILTWNTLDRLRPRERSRLVERLTEISSEDARLHAVVDASDEGARTTAVRYSLLDVDRMRCEPDEAAGPGGPRLLPADVEQVLAPFRVTRGFTLKEGLREYVADRGGRSAGGR